MTLFAGIAIYFVIWWITLLAVLPFGGKPVPEGELRQGHERGAPARTLLLWKMLATTLIAGVLWGVIEWLVVYQPISYDDIPFMPKFTSEYNEPVTLGQPQQAAPQQTPEQQPGN